MYRISRISPFHPYRRECRHHSTTPIAHSLDSGRSVFFVEKNMDGTVNADYHVNLIYLLDEVFMEDSLRFLSIEQERYLNRFFKEAGIVNDIIDQLREEGETDYSPAYVNMDDCMRELDGFLGDYQGKNYEKYAQ